MRWKWWDLKCPFIHAGLCLGSAGHADGNGTQASFHHPTGVAVDGDGNIIVSDHCSHRIRKISPDGSVSTLAGSGSAGHADGHGTQASFHSPYGVAVDGDGNIIVADYASHRIRKISPDGSVSALAGRGSAGHADGHGTQASFDSPCDVVVDGDGNIIVADYGYQRIRKVAAGLEPPAGMSQLPAELPSVFVAHMEALLSDVSLADVTFVVGDVRVKGHCAILVARSEYFRTTLTSGFSEGQGTTTEIPIRDSAPGAFKALIAIFTRTNSTLRTSTSWT